MNIVIYTQPTCADCHAAKQYFDHKGIDYTDHDVTADPDALEELKTVVGRMATPTIVIDDQVFLGFAANRAELEELVQRA
jgi:glutaredoxin 3